ncbi:hypothetical protein [Pseudomonas brassicacearum]|uniref:hypothetical protein n=1 Tax=Pseudomonas brassicacearum TaxID=930166 RepID=UPI001C8294D3
MRLSGGCPNLRDKALCQQRLGERDVHRKRTGSGSEGVARSLQHSIRIDMRIVTLHRRLRRSNRDGASFQGSTCSSLERR